MLWFNKENYGEVLKILKEMQLKHASFDAKLEELESKLDFMKAEIKQQRKKKLNIEEETLGEEKSKDINNPMLLPDNGVPFKHR